MIKLTNLYQQRRCCVILDCQHQAWHWFFMVCHHNMLHIMKHVCVSAPVSKNDIAQSVHQIVGQSKKVPWILGVSNQHVFSHAAILPPRMSPNHVQLYVEEAIEKETQMPISELYFTHQMKNEGWWPSEVQVLWSAFPKWVIDASIESCNQLGQSIQGVYTVSDAVQARIRHWIKSGYLKNDESSLIIYQHASLLYFFSATPRSVLFLGWRSLSHEIPERFESVFLETIKTFEINHDDFDNVLLCGKVTPSLLSCANAFLSNQIHQADAMYGVVSKIECHEKIPISPHVIGLSLIHFGL